MPNGEPFVLKFEHDGKCFVYDVNTNNIMQVDPRLYSLIDQVRVERNNGSPLTWRLANPDPPLAGEDLRLTLEEIEKHNRERAFFSEKRPSKMFFPFSREEMELILDNLVGHIILNITEGCNLRCAYCKFSGSYPLARTHNDKTMDESVALGAVKFMLDRSKHLIENTDDELSVGFYGGEPLLNFPIIRACVDFVRRDYSRIQHRVGYSLTTNLTTRSTEFVDYLADNDFYVLVSLDGPRELHDRYRRTAAKAGSFDQVMRNLRRLRGRNREWYEKKLGFSVVLAPPYDLPAVVDFFQQDELLTGRRMNVSFVDADDTSFFDQFGDMRAINEDLRAQRSVIDDRLRALVINGGVGADKDILPSLAGDRVRDVYNRTLAPLADEIWPNGICLPGFQRFLVSPEGRFYLCEKIGYELQIGDLENGFDVDKIFSIIQEYIDLSESKCLNCWAMRFCKVCFIRAVKGGQFDGRRKDENCRDIKSAIIKGMKLFTELMPANPQAMKDLFTVDGATKGIEMVFDFIEQRRAQKQQGQAAAG